MDHPTPVHKDMRDVAGETTISFMSPADLRAQAREDIFIQKLAREDFNDFFLRNSKIFPLGRKRSDAEEHAMRLAFRRKYDLAFEAAAKFGPECADTVHRMLVSFRKHAGPTGTSRLDASALGAMEAHAGKYAHANAAILGLLVETCLKSGATDRALALCEQGAAKLPEEDALALFHIALFEISENGGCGLSPSAVLQSLAKSKIDPTVDTFDRFVRCCSRVPDGLSLAQSALCEMHRVGLAPAMTTYLALAELLPALTSPSDRYNLILSIMAALHDAPQLAIDDRATSARLHTLLAGQAWVVRDMQLLVDVHYSASKHNPAVTGPGTSIEDTCFWEHVLRVMNSAQHAPMALKWFLQMPTGCTLLMPTYRQLQYEAGNARNYKATARILQDLHDVYHLKNMTYAFRDAANTLLSAINGNFSTATPEHQLSYVNTAEFLMHFFEEHRLVSCTESLVKVLLSIGVEDEAVRILGVVPESERMHVLRRLQGYPSPASESLLQRFDKAVAKLALQEGQKDAQRDEGGRGRSESRYGGSGWRGEEGQRGFARGGDEGARGGGSSYEDLRQRGRRGAHAPHAASRN